MRSLAVRVAIAVLATLVLSPIAGYFIQKPFHRVMTRVFMVAVVIAFLWGAGRVRTWPQKLAAMGLTGPDRGVRFAAGAAVALVLLVVLFAVSFLLDGRTWVDAPHRLGLATHLAKALVAAFAVSFLEEVLCRGYLKDLLGGIASAVVFAAVHYFQPLPKHPLPKSQPAGPDFDPLLGFKRVGELFEAWADPQNATLGFFSLFLFAVALNRFRERTGTLYFGIGVHAGLVFALAFYRRFVHYEATGDPWIFGRSRLHDGLLGTGMLLLLVAIAYLAPLPARMKRPAPRRQ